MDSFAVYCYTVHSVLLIYLYYIYFEWDLVSSVLYPRCRCLSCSATEVCQTATVT